MSARKPGPERRPPAPLSPEDAALWGRVAGAARPLAKRKRPPAPAAPPEPEPEASGDAKAADAPSAPPRAAAPRQHQAGRALPPLTPGAAPGVDRRTADRLRRGQLPIEARLDLHGLLQEEAHAALRAFVPEARADGRRCVLVITGKGRRAEGGRGVLREAAPAWLNEPGLREHVLAFAHARPRDGGAGALYVLLRRSREP